MNTAINKALAIAAVGVLLTPSLGWAQQNRWTGGVGGDWLDSTWSAGGAPFPLFDSEGVIGDDEGSASLTGEVSVTSDIRVSNPSSTVVLGDVAGSSGTLNITSSGKLAVVDQDASSGDFFVGRGGLGVLNVASGGVLEIDGALQSTSGDAGSTISLAGTASVSAGSATFDRQLIIDGSGVSLSTTGNTVFGLAGTHSWTLPAAGVSTPTVMAGGNADLGGTLRVAFTGGAPTAGTTWDLIDAATIDANEVIPSGFSFVDTSAVSGLGPGQRFDTQTVAGGNGQIAQLVLEQHPVLIVNRDTGNLTITNPGGAASIAIDSYAITSPTVGALNPANWNSLDPAGGWLESNPSANALSELNPTGSASFAGNSDTDLGDVFAPAAPASFGQETEDLRFRYSKPDGGFIEGDILYLGVPNNTLTLNVDPSTGEAQIINGTGFTVSIDTYVIDSASGSLLDGDSDWNSLEDQGANGGDWYESNSDANRLSELLVTGGLELSPDEVVDLGTPFDELNGLRDLVFRFALVQGDAPEGDFNNDGVVDAVDYAVWREGLGTEFTSADFDLWSANYGATGSTGGEPGFLTGKLLYGELVTFGGGAAAAPEPGAMLLLASGLALASCPVRRRV